MPSQCLVSPMKGSKIFYHITRGFATLRTLAMIGVAPLGLSFTVKAFCRAYLNNT